MNVDNLKLYKPSMLDQEEEHVQPSMEDLALDPHANFTEDTIFQKRSRTTRNGQHNLCKNVLKGQLQGKVKWYTREKVERQISLPQLVKQIGDQNPPKMGRCDPNSIIILFFIHIDAFEVEKVERSAHQTIFTNGTQFGETGYKTFSEHFEASKDIFFFGGGKNLPL